MPAVTFDIVWPDGSQDQFYSPSTVVHDYFQVGQGYALADFVHRSQTALTLASKRVEQRYGSPCSLALRQLQRVEQKASTFMDQPNAQVTILANDH
ncbi:MULTISPECIES: MSMEG_0570 family nitrogen starvation response protein [unclassified Picosynechococcus]|uniref:MSMEG_0570 family nitrogen starvation response protein n=1 Tax=unclassified Picosynechococcus TaxID=3079910 RepID=UPI0007458041|nr:MULTISPECIES: MSMEG_0570 family nitrogen starvation response protein [unclassified Picosynechococcus]AMA08453.1 hypothetical protein AWQ23_03490 [Picosynechococcus sp. PCC 73109]ANV86596.1 hypothetical protein AWQ22_03415 [Picosynechococcus sp. PCC 7117]QCS49283.1 MSMEG_0570 family nitrogen starvation response protein [Picosynechococcus sp. PCC 11901]